MYLVTFHYCQEVLVICIICLRKLTLGPGFAVSMYKEYQMINTVYNIYLCIMFGWALQNILWIYNDIFSLWFFFLTPMVVYRDSFTLFDIFLILVKYSMSGKLWVRTWAGLSLTHTLAVQNKSPFSFTADHEVNTWAV